VHAAGIAGGGVIPLKTREQAERVFAPKVRGTLVLLDALRGRPVDFVALCSSLAAVQGGAAQVDYCAANAFQDAVARQAAGLRPLVVSIGWDTWRDGGMAVETAVPRAMVEKRSAWIAAGGMSAAEGGEVLARALALRQPHVLVSTVDLGSRLAFMRRPDEAPAEEAAAAAPATPPARHARPALDAPYVPPRDELEQALADVWQELLGFEALGVRDNFFELGGHSLLAMQVVNRLRQTFHVPLKLQTLFDAPTIEAMARAIVAAEPRAGQSLEIARLARSVDSLSDEEVLRLLQDEEATGGHVR
jgi:aryl carrier-like protein